MLKIHSFEFNPFNENTYLLWDDETKETAIIDPGCYDEFEKSELKNFIEEQNLIPKLLINTHCHIDHILGVSFIKENYDVIYLIPEKDLPLHKNASSQGQMFGFDLEELPEPDEFITEEKIIRLGQEELKPLFTPGHTAGEYCFYSEKNKICITGDVLFHQSIGRTDLWGGDYDTLIQSIRTKLLTLPDDTRIFPGHGIDSTIGIERKQNPFLTNI
ncbi:MBL fold metallo-hydrolase [Ignavibacterium sp.]|uniref:MBL fold metallo-hydrolase n=1 Tax=Ignavibacterium sp. TaxID=2651167 RepID=UPI0021FDF95F|nr:MBL fold metallo-hydrolase [Ignavibacterium sp.]BDQ02111.1 MAG: MBL fold hydrolase [Ignavibacterium sp.]